MPIPRTLLTASLLLLQAACVETPADEKLEEAVRLSIHQHPALLGDHLNVQCQDGVVYISGLVATYVEYVEAEQVVKATPGVKQVVNKTSVENQRF